MEDAVLIVSMAALFAFGFIPVIKLERFLRSRRNVIAEPERRPEKKDRRTRDDPVEEFENSGILYFDMPCDPGQIDDGDLPRVE
ncbi:MAG: hypothetical protein IKG85_06760 [Clostridia bacterium]|nr:hypothetical protein [Clostridia bacterium]